MPTQAPQNSAFYFKQAQQTSQQPLAKGGLAKASPKNHQVIQMPNMHNTAVDNTNPQASGQVSATNASRNAKYSPMRKDGTQQPQM